MITFHFGHNYLISILYLILIHDYSGNILKEASLKAVIEKKKSLCVTYKKRRLAFALKYQHWTNIFCRSDYNPLWSWHIKNWISVV